MKGPGVHAGDLLTVGRVVATPLFVWSFQRAVEGTGRGFLPAVVFVAVVLSDCFDGVLARRAGRASPRGHMFDSLADIVFLLAGFSGAVAADVAPWWVPASIAASFAFYVADSWWRTRGRADPGLVGSRVGHVAGVCNYALIGILTFNNACGLGLLGPAGLQAIFCLVPLYSAAAILSRFAGRGPTS